MAQVELIGVPFDGYGRPGNQSLASRALRAAGLAGAFAGHEVLDTGDLDLPPPDPARGRETSLVNERALVACAEALDRRVGAAVAAGRFPVVHGGDCTSLLGVVPGLHRLAPAHGPTALLFLDGHEDTMPLDVSEDGEGANTEIGLLLGVTGRLLEGPLAARRSVLGTDALAMLGQRDGAWRRRLNLGRVRDLGVWSRTDEEMAQAPGAEAAAAVAHLRRTVDRWWLHVDLDVLDADEFPPQGVPGSPDEPGGLSWAALHEAVSTAVSAGGCRGWSVTIYDPEQDPGGVQAREIVRLAGTVARALA